MQSKLKYVDPFGPSVRVNAIMAGRFAAAGLTACTPSILRLHGRTA